MIFSSLLTGQEPFGHIVSENTYSSTHSMSGKESIHHSPLVEGTNNQAEVLHPSLLPPRDRAQEQRGGQASLQAVPGTWVENGRTSFSVLGQVKSFAIGSFRAAKKFSPPRNATTAVARTLVCFVFFPVISIEKLQDTYFCQELVTTQTRVPVQPQWWQPVPAPGSGCSHRIPQKADLRLHELPQVVILPSHFQRSSGSCKGPVCPIWDQL